MTTLIHVCLVALIVGVIAGIFIWLINRAPAPVPAWAKWLAIVIVCLVAILIFLQNTGVISTTIR